MCVSRQEEFGTLVDGMYVMVCHFKELRIPQSYEFEVPGGRNVQYEGHITHFYKLACRICKTEVAL